ncbi:MAG TPA: hypothetical protein VIL20_22870 [Sandaracinaceae bacterium]
MPVTVWPWPTSRGGGEGMLTFLPPALALPVPVLHPLLYEHAAAVLDLPIDALEGLSERSLELAPDGRTMRPRAPDAVEDHRLDATGGAAIRTLLARADLDARLSALRTAGASRPAAPVEGLLARGWAPDGLFFEAIERAPDDIAVQNFADAGRELASGAAFALLAGRCARMQGLLAIAAPAVFVNEEARILNELVTTLVAAAARGLARACRVSDREVTAAADHGWRAVRRGAEAVVLRALELVGESLGSVPQPWGGTLAAEAFLRLTGLFASYRQSSSAG